MPYQSNWVPAEVVLEYKGIIVKKVYEGGDIDYPLSCQYKAMTEDGWDEEVDEDEGWFDVRDLNTFSAHRDHEEVMKLAIDEGSLPTSEE